MSSDRLKYLLEQYVAGDATSGEIKELFRWIKNMHDDTAIKNKIKQLWSEGENNERNPATDWNTIYQKIIEIPVIGHRRSWAKMAAAVIIFAIGFGGYLLLRSDSGQPVVTIPQQQSAPQLLPGGDKAVLTLASGEQIILDSKTDGVLAQEGNTRIIKLNQGRLSYNVSIGKPAEIQYNTISTPKGGQYQIVLADGTKVWLNAASSLHFPTAFNENKRNVVLTGEGYFEVAKDVTKPFTVVANGMEVQVLGTRFNINAYTDEEEMKATLVEGSVKVFKGNETQVLYPGEQAKIVNDNEDVNSKIRVQQVDIVAATAWINGRFMFKGDDIHSVMRQLARWYDATILYEGMVTHEEFVGVINRSRYDNIADILEMLEKTGTVSFEVQGKSITVMPYKRK